MVLLIKKITLVCLEAKLILYLLDEIGTSYTSPYSMEQCNLFGSVL